MDKGRESSKTRDVDSGKNLVRFDWAIKRLLRHKADHTILNGFLTSLLGEPIRIERILESEGNREYEENKSNRVDMLAEDSHGRKILIEVQNETEDSYFHRMLFGTSKVITEYLRSGHNYDEIARVYSVNIVYFKLGEGGDYVYRGTTEFRGLHDNELLELPAHLKDKYQAQDISDLFPEYYILRADNFNRVARTPLEQWMHFLKNSSLPEGADAPGLREAGEEFSIARLSIEDRRDYERYMDNMVSLEAMMDSALYRGKYEGIKIGLEQGIEQGIEQEKWNSARNFYKLGVDISTISQATGIGEEELRRHLKK